MPATVRPTTRVLLINDQSVLMLHVDDPTVTTGPNPLPRPDFWMLPGGGVEPGETYETAAHREIYEELGLTDITLGPHIGTRNAVVNWGGRHWDIREHYFAGRINNGTISFANLTPPELPVVKAHRWWTTDEITTSPDLFVPPNVIDHITAALAAVF